MIFYFSATGNSEWVAKMLAHLTGDQVYDISSKTARPDIRDQKQVGFVFPVYAWGVPEPMENFVKSLPKGKAFAFGVCTCGSEAGMAMKHFSKTYPLNSSYSLVMPNNYIVGSDTDSEQTIRAKLPEGFQRAEFILEHGFADMVVERKDLPSTIAYLLFLHDRTAWGDPARAVPHCRAAFPEQPRWPRPHHEQRALDPERATPYDLVRRVRDTSRASVPTVAEQAFEGLVELHGDREFGDDPAIVGGIALLRGRPVTVICTDRGRNTKERVARNFGSPKPEGYRKALRLMRQAQKFGRPVVTLVDTSGAYPGMEAEERGQGAAIADDIMAMSGLAVPEVAVIMGEGGSGGALALATADRVLMLSDAVYSVVSPESCATILWKSQKRAAEAADALGITAKALMRLGIVDGEVDAEGLGTSEFAWRLAGRIHDELAELGAMGTDDLLAARYERFRKIGRYDA